MLKIMDFKWKIIFMWIVLDFNSVIALNSRPHIIMIVADDLGWNDVGFHGSIQIPTPNIDALAYAGVILNNYYVQPICTPSRSALLSGMHPIHTGLNHDVIYGPQPYGLPLNYQLLPNYLNSLGYTSQLVGKWHIGSCLKEYTPTYRGFKSHYGYWLGHLDYYSHMSMEGPGWWGYDFRRNMMVDRQAYGKYTTDLFTDESIRVINEHNSSVPLFLYLAHLAVHSANPYDSLQAPAEIVQMFSYIQDENRRKFAGMLWKLDDSIGQVVKALEDNGMLENSVIVFTTDNGGPAAGFNDNAASNWPLRGVKTALWEGGVRGSAFVWSPLINNPGRVSMDMMQIMDWVPTLYRAAGGKLTDLPYSQLDGIDAWDSIRNASIASSRTQMLHNIDPIQGGAAVRVGDWKLLFKPSGYGAEWDVWFGPSGRSLNETYSLNSKTELKMIQKSLAGKAIEKYMPKFYNNIKRLKMTAEVLCGPVPQNATEGCDDPAHPCLFHIPTDPCEYYDVAYKNPSRVQLLQSILNSYNDTAVPPLNKPWDPAANPIFWDYTWTNWQDYDRPSYTQLRQAYIPSTEFIKDHQWL